MGSKHNDETVKYKLIAEIRIEGISSESDIVGALFGQTEGLLDSEMDFKQLQKSGRIGRIGLHIENKDGATVGKITIPSSLNKIETAIIAATLESVDRVGPCACSIKLDKIIDVRKEKRDKITKRASEIMKQWDVETREEVKNIPSIVEKDAKRGRIVTFGPDRLPAGPEIFKSPDILLVEGRADVINLLKMNIQNTIAIEGTNISATIKNLCKNRTVTVLLDGDRGGDMILKELLLVASIDYIARAPYRKEVEDLSYDEVIDALETKLPLSHAKFMTEKTSIPDFLKNRGKIKNHSSTYQHRSSMWSNRVKSEGNGKGISERSKKQKSVSKPRKVFRQKRDNRATQSSAFKPRQKAEHRKPKPMMQPTTSHRKTRSDKTREPARASLKDRIKKRFVRKDKPHRSQKFRIHKDLHNLVNKTKQTFNAVFVNKNHKPMITVPTAEAFNQLQVLDGVDSIIIDGIITQRFIDIAHKKSVQLIAGAMVGKLTITYDFPQITTFNRISH